MNIHESGIRFIYFYSSKNTILTIQQKSSEVSLSNISKILNLGNLSTGFD